MSNELIDPPERIDNAATYHVLEPGDAITMPLSDTDWEVGPIQQERYREHGPELSGDVSEISALGIVTQVRGPFPS